MQVLSAPRPPVRLPQLWWPWLPKKEAATVQIPHSPTPSSVHASQTLAVPPNPAPPQPLSPASETQNCSLHFVERSEVLSWPSPTQFQRAEHAPCRPAQQSRPEPQPGPRQNANF